MSWLKSNPTQSNQSHNDINSVSWLVQKEPRPLQNLVVCRCSSISSAEPTLDPTQPISLATALLSPIPADYRGSTANERQRAAKQAG